MTKYQFETDQFGLSETGIHLLRSRFNYETIELSSVYNIAVDRGRQVNNWIILLMFGLALSLFGAYTGVKLVYDFFFVDDGGRFHIMQFVVPVLPLFAGIYCVFSALHVGPVLVVSAESKKKRFPIGQLGDKAQVEALIFFLENNRLTKDKFELKLKP